MISGFVRRVCFLRVQVFAVLPTFFVSTSTAFSSTLMTFPSMILINGMGLPISVSIKPTYLWSSLLAAMLKARPDFSSPACTANAVNIIFGMARHIKIENMAKTINI